MKNHFRVKIRKDLLHALTIQDVADNGRDPPAMPQPNQLLFDLEHARFRPIDQEQTFGTTGGDLPAKLAADAAAGAGHQDHPIPQGASNGLGLQFDPLPSEQVLDFDIPQLTYSDLSQGQLVQRGDRFAGQTGFAQDANDLCHAPGRSRGHRYDGFVNFQFSNRIPQLFRWAKDRDVMHARVPFSLVVVKERDWDQTIAAFERQFMGQHRPGIACPNDAHAPPLPAAPLTRDGNRLSKRAQGQTDTG